MQPFAPVTFDDGPVRLVAGFDGTASKFCRGRDLIAQGQYANLSSNFTAMAAYQGKHTGETPLLRTILDRLLPGGILLAARYYASSWLPAMSELRGIDLVARAHHLRKVDSRRGLKQAT